MAACPPEPPEGAARGGEVVFRQAGCEAHRGGAAEMGAIDIWDPACYFHESAARSPEPPPIGGTDEAADGSRAEPARSGYV